MSKYRKYLFQKNVIVNNKILMRHFVVKKLRNMYSSSTVIQKLQARTASLQLKLKRSA